MNANRTENQPMLVSDKYGKKYVVGTLTALAVMISTPVYSHTKSTSKKAVTNTQITLVLNEKSRKSGKAIYICSPAGFGKKSSCYRR
jgi:hypothetical protein